MKVDFSRCNMLKIFRNCIKTIVKELQKLQGIPMEFDITAAVQSCRVPKFIFMLPYFENLHTLL